jgi:glutamate synthase (NADPH/NADH) small chain
MSEYQRPITEADLAQNFEQLHPLMDDTMAHYASAKCLYCYDAPCISACPTAIDIPLFIRQIRTQNIDGAAKTIYDSNYFGQICGKVCPTEVLCEGACVYNDQDQLPVEIGALQTYACNHAIQKNAQLFDLAPDNGKKVAVIGAGPSGIACACELRMHGYTVDVFEAKAMPSGLALHGTAPYKIINGEVLEEVAFLEEQFQFNLYLNQPIDTAEKLNNLESNYDAVFLGIGLGETTHLGIPGEDLKGCMGAIEFIETVKLDPTNAFPGDRVVVIGGGNTAMDAASESARLGAKEVTLAYRRSRAEMSAYDFEYDLVKSAGVLSEFNVSPIEIHGTDHVEQITFIRTRNANGKLEEIPGSQFTIACDAVILATGQSKFVDLLKTVGGIELNKSGAIVVDDSGQTAHPKYFAGGDAMNGGAEVVNAAAEGKRAARGIHEFLIID